MIPYHLISSFQFCPRFTKERIKSNLKEAISDNAVAIPSAEVTLGKAVDESLPLPLLVR
jgi:hypothetical protein